MSNDDEMEAGDLVRKDQAGALPLEQGKRDVLFVQLFCELLRLGMARLPLEERRRVAGIVGTVAPRRIQRRAKRDELEDLAEALMDDAADVRRAAAAALVGRSPGPMDGWAWLVQTLLAGVGDADPAIRAASCRALGHLPDEVLSDARVVRALLGVAGDAASAVRKEAVEALGNVGAEPEVLSALLEAVRGEDVRVGKEAAESIARMPPDILNKETVDTLLSASTNGDADTRAAATKALGGLPADVLARDAEAVVARLRALLRDPDRDVRSTAARAIRAAVPVLYRRVAQDARFIETIRQSMLDEFCDVRAEAAAILALLVTDGPVDGRVVDQLLAAAQDEDCDVRAQAALALGRLRPEVRSQDRVVTRLLEVAGDEDCDARAAAVESLGRLPPKRVGEPGPLATLLSALRDEDWGVRTAAAAGLGRLPDRVLQREEVVHALLSAAEDDEWRVYEAAAKSLARLSASRDDDVLKALMAEQRLLAASSGASSGSGDVHVAQRPQDRIGQVARVLRNKHPRVRLAAAERLRSFPTAALQSERMVTALCVAMGDPHAAVREATLDLLARLLPMERLTQLYRDYDDSARTGFAELFRDYSASREELDPARFLVTVEPLLVWLHFMLGSHAAALTEEVLERKGSMGLLRFLEPTLRLTSRQQVRRFAQLFLSDRTVLDPMAEPMVAIGESGAAFWQGRSLIAPMGGGKLVCLKLLRAGQPEQRLGHEIDMMEAISSVGIASPAPIRNSGRRFWVLPEEFGAPPRVEVEASRKGIMSLTAWDRVCYPPADLSWLPLGRRREILLEVMRSWVEELNILHRLHFAPRTLLAISHDTVNHRPWDISVGQVGIINPYFQGLQYPNLRMKGIADYEEIEQGPPNLGDLKAQNLLEVLLYGAYLAVGSGLHPDEGANLLGTVLSRYGDAGNRGDIHPDLAALVRATRYGLIVDHCSFRPLRNLRPELYRITASI